MMKHTIVNPFTTTDFPTFGDIPREYRSKFANKYRRRDGTYEKKLRMMKYMWISYFGNQCPSCGVDMTTSLSKVNKANAMTIDHILARSLGGATRAEYNLTCICRSCNGYKSAYECKISMFLWNSCNVKQAA